MHELSTIGAKVAIDKNPEVKNPDVKNPHSDLMNF